MAANINKKGKTIFEMEVCYIENKYSAKKDDFFPVSSYPFDLSRQEVSFFTSLHKAESAIQKRVKEYTKNHYRDLYCFYVTEYSIDSMDGRDTLTQRSYFSDGKPAERCLTSDKRIEEKMDINVLINKTPEELHRIGLFPGRRPEEFRFQEGDLVEVVKFNRVIVGIVTSTPWREEYVKERAIKVGWFFQDFSDDNYTILECFPAKKEATHRHSRCTDLFPLRFSISKRLKEGLQLAYKTWKGEDNSYEIY